MKRNASGMRRKLVLAHNYTIIWLQSMRGQIYSSLHVGYLSWRCVSVFYVIMPIIFMTSGRIVL